MTIHHYARCICAALLLSPSLGSAQQLLHCGTEATNAPAIVARALAAPDLRDATRYVQVKVVIAAVPTVEGGQFLAAQPSTAQRDLDDANAIFDVCGTDIQFQLCGPMEARTLR